MHTRVRSVSGGRLLAARVIKIIRLPKTCSTVGLPTYLGYRSDQHANMVLEIAERDAVKENSSIRRQVEFFCFAVCEPRVILPSWLLSCLLRFCCKIPLDFHPIWNDD